MAKPDPYLQGDKWTLDVDPDDIVNYVWNVSRWLSDNSTTAVSFELIPTGCTVIEQGAPQGTNGSLLPAKIQLVADFSGQASCTARVTTADGQQFDKTMYFNRVQN